MKAARLLAPAEMDPSPVLDCTAVCEPGHDEGMLWGQCVITCAPYQDSEGAKQVGVRKGVGLKLARALIPWAEAHG